MVFVGAELDGAFYPGCSFFAVKHPFVFWFTTKPAASAIDIT